MIHRFVAWVLQTLCACIGRLLGATFPPSTHLSLGRCQHA